MNQINYSVYLYTALFLQLVGLAFVVVIDPYIRRKHKRILLLNVFLVVSLIIQNYMDYALKLNSSSNFALKCWAVYGYAIRPVIITLYLYIISDRKKHGVTWILLSINCLIYMTTFFSHICFWYTEEKHFHRGPLGFSCHIVSGILLLEIMMISIKKYRSGRRTESWIPIMNAVTIITAILLDTMNYVDVEPVSFLTIAIVSNSIFYYIWLHIQFVREHEEDLKAQQRIKIMMTQIQPHFLYNTLSTIKALCKTDPQRAAKITEKFGTYLRQNMDSINMPDLIPFEKEIEHTKLYAEIEMTRFSNVHVNYDIRENDFKIPALTVQPMVENAIKYGVRIRDYGIVNIISCKKDDCYEIIIKDNGIGFEPDKIADDGKHIGIKNVRERIESLCKGSLLIESIKDKGTTVIITIPER